MTQMNILPERDKIESATSWFAVKTHPMHEQMVSDLLQQVGYETFLPLYIKSFKMRGLMKRMRLPLFARYVFCRSTPTAKTRIVSLPGVAGLIGFASGQGSIPNIEIQEMKRVIAAAQWLPYERERGGSLFMGYAEGTPVRVKNGPLAGLQGMLVKRKDIHRIVISIALIQKSVAVEIDSSSIESISA